MQKLASNLSRFPLDNSAQKKKKHHAISSSTAASFIVDALNKNPVLQVSTLSRGVSLNHQTLSTNINVSKLADKDHSQNYASLVSNINTLFNTVCNDQTTRNCSSSNHEGNISMTESYYSQENEVCNIKDHQQNYSSLNTLDNDKEQSQLRRQRRRKRNQRISQGCDPTMLLSQKDNDNNSSIQLRSEVEIAYEAFQTQRQTINNNNHRDNVNDHVQLGHNRKSSTIRIDQLISSRQSCLGPQNSIICQKTGASKTMKEKDHDLGKTNNRICNSQKKSLHQMKNPRNNFNANNTNDKRASVENKNLFKKSMNSQNLTIADLNRELQTMNRNLLSKSGSRRSIVQNSITSVTRKAQETSRTTATASTKRILTTQQTPTKRLSCHYSVSKTAIKATNKDSKYKNPTKQNKVLDIESLEHKVVFLDCLEITNDNDKNDDDQDKKEKNCNDRKMAQFSNQTQIQQEDGSSGCQPVDSSNSQSLISDEIIEASVKLAQKPQKPKIFPFSPDKQESSSIELTDVKLRVQQILEAYESKIKNLTQTVDELTHENKILKRRIYTQVQQSQ